jgi:hypothetical protein
MLAIFKMHECLLQKKKSIPIEFFFTLKIAQENVLDFKELFVKHVKYIDE